MANETQTFEVKLTADGSKLTTETKAATKTVQQLEKELTDLQKKQKTTGKASKNLGKDVDRMGSRFQNAAASMAVIQGPLGGIAGRMNTLGAALNRNAARWLGLSVAIGGSLLIQKQAIGAFIETENQLARIDSQLKLTGNGVGFTTDQLDNFARQQARLTLSSSEDIREATSVMLTFRSVSGETFKDAIRASNSIAAITGASVKSIAIQLGKALEDARTGLTALRRQGISFTTEQRREIIRLADEGRKSEAAERLLAIINTQIPDASAGVGELAGKVDSLQQSWRELLETVAAGDLVKTGTGILDSLLRGAKEIISPDDEVNASRLAKALKRVKEQVEDLQKTSEKGIFFKFLVSKPLEAARAQLAGLRAEADSLLEGRSETQAKESVVADIAAAKQAAIEKEEIDRVAHKRRLTFSVIESRRAIAISRSRARTEAGQVKAQFKNNEISAAEFYAKLDALAIKSNELEIAAVKAKIASLQFENATVIQIARETSKLKVLTEARKDAIQSNAIALAQEELAIDKLVTTTQRQLAVLTGGQVSSQLAQLEEEMNKLKTKLEANGRDSKIVEELFAVKKAQIGFDVIDSEFQKLLTSMARVAQNIDVDISTGILTELQGRRELNKLHDDTLVKIKAIIPAAKQMSEAIGTDEAKQNLQEIIDKVVELERRTNVIVNEIKGSFEDAFVDTLSGLGNEITTLDQLWRSFAENVVSSLQNIAAERLTAELFSLIPGGDESARGSEGGGAVSQGLGAVGAVAGAVAGGGGGDSGVSAGDQLIAGAVNTQGESQKQGLVGQIGSLIASIFTTSATTTTTAATTAGITQSLLSTIAISTSGMFTIMQAEKIAAAASSGGDIALGVLGALKHSGGVVGGSGGGASRRVGAATFAGAGRFHNGGFPGLSNDEVPAILQKGEEVVTRDDPRNALNRGSGGSGAAPPQINVMNVLDTSVLHDETATFLNSGDGERAIVNIMQKNRNSLGL